MMEHQSNKRYFKYTFSSKISIIMSCFFPFFFFIFFLWILTTVSKIWKKKACVFKITQIIYAMPV